MGHLHLGTLPKTREWKEVVALIAGGADATQIANAAVHATEGAFRKVFDDRGLVESVWLLLRLPLAARAGDFVEPF